MILCSSVIILHSIGFYLLRNVKRGKFNVNNILLTCFSGNEILYGVNNVLYHVLAIQGNLSRLIVFHIEIFAVVPLLNSTLFLITLNRYIACIHPRVYRKYATKKSLATIIVSTWLFSLVAGVVVWLVWNSDTTTMYWWMTISVNTIFIFMLFAYIRIYLRLANSSQRVSIHLPGQQNLKLHSILWNYVFHQGHITSVCIVVCYFLFIIIPVLVTFVLFLYDTCYSCLLWFGMMANLNCILDAIIYIYTDRDVRKLWVKKVHRMMSL